MNRQRVGDKKDVKGVSNRRPVIMHHTNKQRHRFLCPHTSSAFVILNTASPLYRPTVWIYLHPYLSPSTTDCQQNIITTLLERNLSSESNKTEYVRWSRKKVVCGKDHQLVNSTGAEKIGSLINLSTLITTAAL